MNTPKPRFRGVIPPLVTPLTDPDRLDAAGLERLVEHVLGGGVHGIFVLGTTGEAPSISYPLRGELVERVCELVAGRVPVLVGVTDTSFVESVNLAEIAADAGAAAVVLSTPYYFPAGQDELAGYVERISDELPLPLMLYNMPSLTKVCFEIDTLRRLAQIDRIVGVKDSGGDLDYYERLLALHELRADWSLLIGPEHLLARSLRLGGDGGVSGGANMFPHLFVACYEAALQGDDVRLGSLERDIKRVQQVYEVGKEVSRYIKATKCVLSLRNICDDFMAEPFQRFTGDERAQVERVLDALPEHVLRRGNATIQTQSASE